MICPILPQSVRDALYEDDHLGAGNFLFKAYALSTTRDVPFLFLEKTFTTPFGDTFDQFSLNQLYQTVADLAYWYRANEVRAGSHVCTYTEEGISPFLHFLALNSIGAVPVPINGKMAPQLAAVYAKVNSFDFFVFDADTNARTAISRLVSDIRLLDASVAGFPRERQALADWPVDKAPDDTVMICHSSGTTGVPKAVIFAHAQFFNGKRERLRSFIETRGERMLTAFPHSHSAGISYLMTATMLGLPTKVLTELTGATVAAHIRQFRPTVMVAFPQTYVSLVEMNLAPDAFDAIRRFYNTGDSAHEVHIKRLIALAPGARFFDGFGASELGMSCFWKVSSHDSITSRRCVGQAAPYATAKIVDALGVELPLGQPGYLSVKSPTVTPGYFRAPHLTELCRNREGYWLTGDVGYLDDSGSFYHLDRAVDVIVSAGGPVYSLALEELLQQLPGVHDAHVIGVSRIPTREQSVVALIVPSGDGGLDLNAVLQQILEHKPLQDAALPDFAVSVGMLNDGYRIPLGATGKVLKRSLRESFWDSYRGFRGGDRSVFSALLWNGPGTPQGAGQA